MFNNLKVSGLKFDLPNDLHNVIMWYIKLCDALSILPELGLLKNAAAYTDLIFTGNLGYNRSTFIQQKWFHFLNAQI